MKPTNALKAGGTLGPNDFYVRRSADREILGALRAQEFCYVLAPRQMGKSSLWVRTALALREGGVHCVAIDLSELGSGVTTEEWYFSIADRITQEMGLSVSLENFWDANHRYSHVQRLMRFLRQEVAVKGSVVIFLDEIDTILSLQQDLDRDDFFAAIRAWHNARAEEPTCRNLTFCLLGVAAPGDLMRDPTRTPFNIGRSIRLEDFSREEANGFRQRLADLGETADRVLDEIYHWTQGHPYMTQRVCLALREQLAQETESARLVAKFPGLIQELFLRGGRSSDTNLSYAELRLERFASKSELLALYNRLLDGPVTLDIGDKVQTEARLCGLAAERVEAGERRLFVRNRIFAMVFNKPWIRDRQEKRELLQWQESWEQSGRASDLLLRGGILDRLRMWAQRHSREVTSGEHEYLMESLRMAHEEERRERKLTQVQAQQRLLIVLAGALTLVAALSVGLFMQYRRAESERYRAQAVARTERSLRSAALARQPGQQLLALVVGMQAARPELLDHDPRGQDWEGLQTVMRSVIPSAQIGHHATGIHAAAFSPSGQHVVTAGDDGVVQIWNVRTQRLVHALSGHTATVHSAVFSPDGRWILTASSDGTARLWEAESGRGVRSLAGHAARVNFAAFSQDGQRTVTASEDGTATIWDVESGRPLHVLKGHSAGLWSAMFSPDRRRVVSASRDKTAWVWDAESGQALRPLTAHSADVTFAAFSPDSLRVVTASEDGTAVIWGGETGHQELRLEEHSAGLLTASFSPDGKRALTASRDRTARIWDAHTGRLIFSLEGHSGEIRSAGFSSDGHQIVTASADRTVRVWNLQAERPILSIEGHSDEVKSVAFSPDGRWIATSSRDSTARIWDARTGRQKLDLGGHAGGIMFVAYSPDGHSLATAGWDKTVRIWEADTGQPRHLLVGHAAQVRSAVFSPDGRRIVTASEDKTLRIWDAPTGQFVRTLEGHQGGIFYAEFSPDGTRIVSSGRDKSARVWDAQSGALIACLSGHSDGVRAAAFSPDGQWIVTASDDRTAKVWDAGRGQELLTLAGHSAGLRFASFSHDGQRLVTASRDKTARLWDARSGRLLASLAGHSDAVLAAGFSPDDTHIVTGSMDKTVLIHPARHQAVYAFGCRVLLSFPDLRAAVPDVLSADLEEALSGCPHAMGLNRALVRAQ